MSKKVNINALTKFGQILGLVLMILSGKEMMTDGLNDRQPKSNIAPLFLASLLVTSPECVYIKSKNRESIACELP